MAEDRDKEQYVFMTLWQRPYQALSTDDPTGNLEYVDETADWAKHYAQGVQSDTASDDDTRDEAALKPARTSPLRSSSGHEDPSRALHSGHVGPPTPVQVIPRSSDVFEYPSKRRKTNESMPSIARSSSYPHESPSGNFSLPLPSPNFSFSGLQSVSQTFDKPQSVHGSSPSLEFASLLDSARLSDRGQHHDTTIPAEHSARIAANDFNAGKVSVSNSADGPYDLLSPRFWTQQSVWPYPTLQEACLMRYFVENLAHWVRPHFFNLLLLRYIEDAKPIPSLRSFSAKTLLSKLLTVSSLIFAIHNATLLLSYHSVHVAAHHFSTPSSQPLLDISLGYASTRRRKESSISTNSCQSSMLRPPSTTMIEPLRI